VIVITALVSAGTVHAQQVSAVLDESVTRLVTKPGKTVYVNNSIVNNGDPQVFLFRLYRMSDPDTRGNMSLAEVAEEPVSVTLADDDLQLGRPFLMRNREKREFRVRIDVPADAKDGEYAYALVAETEAPLPAEGAVTTRISGGIGSTYYIAVSATGEDRKNAGTALFQLVAGTSPWLLGANAKMAESGAPVPVVLVVQNSGKYITIPRGHIRVRNWTSGKSDTYSLVPAAVFPGAQRLMVAAGFDPDSCAKDYGDLCGKDYSLILPGTRFGVYEVTATVSYGEKGVDTYARDYYVVLPYRALGITMLILIVVLVFVLYELRKHHLLERATIRDRKREESSLFKRKS
jgi:hypothetical protein